MTDTAIDDWTAPCPPERVVIVGRAARLEPLDADAHAADLWAALHADDRLWQFMSYGPFASQPLFRAWLESRCGCDDPLAFAVIDAASGQARGLLSLMAVRPESGVIEIGHIVLSPALQKTAAATQALFLALSHVFALGYRRVEWKCDARNSASRRAAKRLGFLFEGLFHQHMIVKGENRDTAWFAVLDREWPALKPAFEAWLGPENFDAAGRQRRPLVSFQPD